MNALTHALAQEWILSGRDLDPEEASELASHLAGCPQCRDLAAARDELAAVVPHLYPPVRNSEGEIRRRTALVQNRLKQKTAASRIFHGTRSLAYPLAAVALLAVLAFVIARLIPEQTRLTPGGPGRTPSDVRAISPTSTLLPSITPTASPIIAPSSSPPALPPPAALTGELASYLKVFPLVTGAQWTYIDTEYDPAPNDPTQIIQAVFEITDTVVDMKATGPSYVAHVQRKVVKMTADPDWSDQNHNPPAAGDLWYTVQAGQVFSKNLNYAGLTLEFQLPLAVGAQWCPNSLTKGYLDPATPTEAPCASGIGLRIVRSEGPFQSPAGSFANCFLLDDVYNTGDTLQTFCEGVGVVEIKFDHPGTRFGFSWVLQSFKAASATVGATPSPAHPAGPSLTP